MAGVDGGTTRGRCGDFRGSRMGHRVVLESSPRSADRTLAAPRVRAAAHRGSRGVRRAQHRAVVASVRGAAARLNTSCGTSVAILCGVLPQSMEPGSIMLARERVLQTLLELTHGPASLTPVELGTRLLDVALSVVDCDGVALTAPRHRDGIRLLRGRQPAHYEPEAMTREGSPFLRQISRMSHPLMVADLATELRAGEEDRFPGLPPG